MAAVQSVFIGLWLAAWLQSAGAAGAGTGIAYPQVSVPMAVQRVSEHVYYVQGAAGAGTENQGFISNAGFVVTGNGVVVFDALGTPSLANELRKRIRQITAEPITKVVVSHYHADHIYGLQVFEDLGAEIIAPYGAQTYLDSEAAAERLEERRFSLEPWVNEYTRLVVPDVTVDRSTRFRLGEVDFLLSYLGAAHSDGDLALLVEPDRVLFSGDIIFAGRLPFVGNADTQHWLETLKRMETEGLAALIPGHGPTSTRAGRTIALTRRYLSYLRQTMGAAVEAFQPFDEAYAQTDWSEFEHLPTFDAANRINAYQVYLSMEAELLAQ